MNRITSFWLLLPLLIVTALPTGFAEASDCEYNRERLDQMIRVCGSQCPGMERARQIVADSCGYSSQQVSTAVRGYDRALQAAQGSASASAAAGKEGGEGMPQEPKAEGGGEGEGEGEGAGEDDPFEPLDPAADHTGAPCQFFTRPAVETNGIAKTLNYYADGAYVCYGEQMYICENRRWKKGMQCSSYQDSWKYRAERLESR